MSKALSMGPLAASALAMSPGETRPPVEMHMPLRDWPCLEDLYAAHQGKVSFRWSSYLPVFDRALRDHRERNINFLEIGVQNGGSLEIWAKFFPNANRLLGCDINPDCAALTFDDPRVHLVIGDVSVQPTLDQILQKSPEFDVIIDDGSHRSGDIIRAFASLFGHLANDGLYVIEDLHATYWQQFEGGLYNPHGAMAFFKRCADLINHEHWGVSIDRAVPLQGICDHHGVRIVDSVLATIHSIEFVNSMCLIRKKPAAENGLGKTVIVGSREAVVSGHLPMNGRDYFFAEGFTQESNQWATMPKPPEELYLQAQAEQDRLREALEAQRRDLESRLQAVEGELALVRGSRTWQMTAPIRRAVSWLRQWRGRFSSH